MRSALLALLAGLSAVVAAGRSQGFDERASLLPRGLEDWPVTAHEHLSQASRHFGKLREQMKVQTQLARLDTSKGDAAKAKAESEERGGEAHHEMHESLGKLSDQQLQDLVRTHGHQDWPWHRPRRGFFFPEAARSSQRELTRCHS